MSWAHRAANRYVKPSHTRRMLRTTMPDILLAFCRTQAAHSAFDQWLLRESDVATVMLGHVTQRVYDVTSRDIEDIARTTKNALGSVRQADAARLPAMRDWTSPFPLAFALHRFAEDVGVSTFDEFRTWCSSTPMGQLMVWNDLVAVQQELCDSGAHHEHVMNASRWRIGNAYYGFMRELYVASILRECGLDIRLHPVAQRVFHVDAWTPEMMLSVTVGNSSHQHGSKRRLNPSLLNGHAMRHHSITLDTPVNFGRIHLPERAAVERAAVETKDISS